ncbi:hypothetical protein IPA_03180 [Ignicoccus pacificus DSM 13166]|uniref:Agmatinase n=1 Tax=Ignicoccus pacificus DSM 13166 TaxID=940294 RepID=A0A977KAV4_9CREN|nr:hypothetical protein IPA_03180 [Ignicoccus pacificus DSM 13166]
MKSPPRSIKTSFLSPQRVLIVFSEPLAFGGEKREDSPFAVLGFPFEGTASFRGGTSEGPNAIRHASKYIEFLANYVHFNMDYVLYDDLGDVPTSPGMVRESLNNLEVALQGIEKIPIILGGEHTLSYSAVKVLEPDCLLVFDAHLDLRDEYLGNAWSHACWLRRLLEERKVKTMVYGARGFADEEVEFAKGRVALGKRIGDVSRWIKGCKDVYISVDVDVFDPSLTPGVGNPEPLGISFDEFLKAVAEALFKVPLKGMDVVEVSPPYDPSGITAVLATKVVVETTAMHYVTWEKRKLTS